jgi:hypothetical protein
MNTAEKIETIVLCYMQHGTASGECGTLVDVAAFTLAAPGVDPISVAGCYRVEADDSTFIVRCAAEGWRVQRGGYTGCDADLYTAAKLATDAEMRHVGTVTQALGRSP